MTDLITIANDHLTAQINPHGAELTHLHDADGRELMTDADPAFWTGHAPILFPVVGVVNEGVIRLDGQAYPMQKHGFARHSTFDVVAQSETSATFRLTDSEETRKAYPFAFALDIVFTLDGAPLLVMTSGSHRVDTGWLGDQLGGSIKRADAALVKEATGQTIGGVAPIGHPAPLRTIVDAQLTAYPQLWAAAGHAHTVFPLSFDELVRITGGEVRAVEAT